MNTKHWFTWVCVAVLIVSEIMLFRANHARDAALADLQDARLKLQQTQSDQPLPAPMTARSKSNFFMDLR